MPWLEYKAYYDFLIRNPWFLNPYFSNKKDKKKKDTDKEDTAPEVYRRPEDFPEPKPLKKKDSFSKPTGLTPDELEDCLLYTSPSPRD